MQIRTNDCVRNVGFDKVTHKLCSENNISDYNSFSTIISKKNERMSSRDYNEYERVNKNNIDKKFYKTENNHTVPSTSQIGQATNNSPLWHWHDGQYGYNVEVYRNENSESDYIVKLKYDDGKEEERIVNINSIDTSNCNIIDLSVKMYHLEAEGKIENPAPQILSAYIYLRYRNPDANENTTVNYRDWFEQQLLHERRNNDSQKNINALIELLKWL